MPAELKPQLWNSPERWGSGPLTGNEKEPISVNHDLCIEHSKLEATRRFLLFKTLEQKCPQMQINLPTFGSTSSVEGSAVCDDNNESISQEKVFKS